MKLFLLSSQTDPQRDTLFNQDPSDVLDTTSEIASGSKPGIDATKKLPGEGEGGKTFQPVAAGVSGLQTERAGSPQENSPGQAK